MRVTLRWHIPRSAGMWLLAPLSLILAPFFITLGFLPSVVFLWCVALRKQLRQMYTEALWQSPPRWERAWTALVLDWPAYLLALLLQRYMLLLSKAGVVDLLEDDRGAT